MFVAIKKDVTQTWYRLHSHMLTKTHTYRRTHTHCSSLGKAKDISLLVLLSLCWVFINCLYVCIIFFYLAKWSQWSAWKVNRKIFSARQQCDKKAWDGDPVVWKKFLRCRTPDTLNYKPSLKVLIASFFSAWRRSDAGSRTSHENKNNQLSSTQPSVICFTDPGGLTGDGFTLCRCTLLLSACTACIPRSSTSAPGTGRAPSPLCFVCCGLGRNR